MNNESLGRMPAQEDVGEALLRPLQLPVPDATWDAQARGFANAFQDLQTNVVILRQTFVESDESCLHLTSLSAATVLVQISSPALLVLGTAATHWKTGCDESAFPQNLTNLLRQDLSTKRTDSRSQLTCRIGSRLEARVSQWTCSDFGWAPEEEPRGKHADRLSTPGSISLIMRKYSCEDGICFHRISAPRRGMQSTILRKMRGQELLQLKQRNKTTDEGSHRSSFELSIETRNRI